MSSRTWTPGRTLGVLIVLAIPVVGISMLDEVPPGAGPGQRRVEQGPLYTPPPLPIGAPQEGLTFEVGGQQDVRGFSRLALYVPAGRPAADFLPAGAFTATFKGRLQVPRRDRYTFGFVGTGDLELRLGEELVLSVVDGQVTSNGSPRLKKGRHVLTATYASPESGPAVMRVYWQSRDFAREPVPAAALAHDSSPALRRYGDLRRGRALAQRYRCAACHEDTVAGRGAPALFGVGDRLRVDWMAEWIEDPRRLRTATRMPKLLHGPSAPADARDIAAYLATLKGAAPSPDLQFSDQQRQDGREIFADYGCLACHSLPAGRTEPAAQRIPLDRVSAKWQSAALAEFLANPARHFPDTQMPDYSFSAEQARAVAAFLMSIEGPPAPSASGGDPAAGERLAGRLGCGSCHALTAPSSVRAAPRAVTRAGVVACSFADFGLSEEDQGYLREYLTSPRRGAFTAVEYAERSLQSQRCVACHDYDGEEALLARLGEEARTLVEPDPGAAGGAGKPPALTHAGSKLQTPWLTTWLREGAQPRPRPWLAMPMPKFRLDAPRLARGLAFAHGYAESGGPASLYDGMLVDGRNAPTVDHGTPAAGQPTPEALAEIGGGLLVQDGGFACTGCHAVGSKAAESVFEAPGIDLALTASRLRKEYFHRWLLDPTRIDPATKMTRFIDGDGLSGIMDTLEGRGWIQVEALWQHLATLR